MRDPRDGRARLVRLTAAGRACQRAVPAEIAEIEADWLRRLRAAGTGLRQALTRAVGAPDERTDRSRQET